MRIHIYDAGTGTAVTHPDVAPGAQLLEIVVLEVNEGAYRVGDDTELDVHLTIVELFGPGPAQVVTHHRRKIEVTVAYTGTETKISSHPSTQLKTVRAEALHALGIDAQIGADLALRLPGNADDLPLGAPLGSYVPRSEDAITLDLIHLNRPQG